MDAKQIEYEGTPVVPRKAVADDSNLLDSQWVKVAFMVPESDIQDGDDVKNMYFSSAALKYVDTRIGCNIGINPRPQWTWYSDIRMKGTLAGRTKVSVTNVMGNHGMGSAYSEGIDDPAQKIYMRFGIPKFNSLSGFLLRAFDTEAVILARTGRAPSSWYTLSKLVGGAFTTATFPGFAITVAAGRAVSYLFGRSSSKFFTLKPAMHLYWSMVNLMVINHAVNVGIYKRVLADETDQKLGKAYKLDTDQMNEISALLPDIFNGLGYIDVYAIANKAQRLAMQKFESDFEMLNNADSSSFAGYLKRDMTGDGRLGTEIKSPDGTPTLKALLNHILTFGDYYTTKEGTEAKQENDPRVQDGAQEGEQVTDSPDLNSWKNHADALWRDGAEWAVFRVDHTGSVSESFGNSYAESELSQKLNGVSQQLKEARFSMADGNIFGGVLDSVKNMVTEVVIGAAQGATLGFAGLAAGLGGSGFIDIPKHWQSSSATLPRGSYTIKLISPYNNPVSQMINIWIPFYMLLAGALPRSVGKQGYMSPFYCEIYDRGRLQSRLAAIESINITRGTSNLQFDLYGKCLAIDVTFNVVDLSSIMHMPMSDGTLGSTDMTIDEDNIAADYFAVLSGMDIYSQIYPIPRAQLRATKMLTSLKQKATSPAFHTAVFKNSMENGFLNDITFGGTNLLSQAMGAPVPGASILEGN